MTRMKERTSAHCEMHGASIQFHVMTEDKKGEKERTAEAKGAS